MRTRARVRSDRDHDESVGSPNGRDVSEPHDMPGCRLYRIPDAMRLLSLSRSVGYEQIRAGRLRSVRQGEIAARLGVTRQAAHQRWATTLATVATTVGEVA